MQQAQTQQLDQSRAARESQKPADLEHWLEIGKRIEDPATAEIVVSYLDQHPAVKARIGGLYVRAQDTLQRRRLSLAQQTAEQLEREYASRRQFFQKLGERAQRAGNIAFRSIRLVFRGARDLLLLIQELGTVQQGHVDVAKGHIPQGRRS